MGEKAFTRVQYGRESTKGTAVAATGRFTGSIQVPSDRKPVFPEASLGLRVKSARSVVRQIMVDGATLSMQDAVFQKLPFLFGMGLKGITTVANPATVGQSDYLWDFTHALDAANNPDSYTVEFGDETQAYEIEYCMARRYKIDVKTGQDASVAVEAEIFGRQITATTFTGSIANPTVTDMVANLSRIWIDPAWASLGTTEVTGLMRECSIEILTGVHPKFHAQNSKMFSGYGESYLDCRANFVFEGSSAADTQFDLFQAGTPRAIRVGCYGPQIGTGTPHSLVVDMYGTWEEIIPLGSEKDGDNLHTAIFQTHSDGLSTPHHFAVKVTTNQNTL